jgi:hypothetical protein
MNEEQTERLVKAVEETAEHLREIRAIFVECTELYGENQHRAFKIWNEGHIRND